MFWETSLPSNCRSVPPLPFPLEVHLICFKIHLMLGGKYFFKIINPAPLKYRIPLYTEKSKDRLDPPYNSFISSVVQFISFFGTKTLIS